MGTMANDIDKLAWLCVRDGRLLAARSRGKDLFYVPGGKREPGETDHQALVREVNEELGVDLVTDTLRPAAVLRSPAHGKPEGVFVRLTCYTGEFTGVLRPESEIEELAWVTLADAGRCSAATVAVLEWLKLPG
jgi:8-oxo-dGTP diphosphatase